MGKHFSDAFVFVSPNGGFFLFDVREGESPSQRWNKKKFRQNFAMLCLVANVENGVKS